MKNDPSKGSKGGHKVRSSTIGNDNQSSSGKCSGLNMENSQRADVKKKPSSKNPYPHGMA